MPNPSLPPWDQIDQDLSADRLSAIAAIIVRDINAKIAARDPRDTNWNLMCDCHGWMIGGIHDAAADQYRDWLVPTSKRSDLDLTFRVGGRDGVEVKIFRPDAPEQPSRTLKQANERQRAIQASLGPEFAPLPEPQVRIAIDKDDDGRVTGVTLVQLSLDGELIYAWPIWTTDAATVSIDQAPRPEAIELEEPAVGLQEDDEEKERKDKTDRQQGA
jgi:hypothetical protein